MMVKQNKMWVYHKCKSCGIEIVEKPHEKGVFTMFYLNCKKCEKTKVLDKGSVRIIGSELKLEG